MKTEEQVKKEIRDVILDMNNDGGFHHMINGIYDLINYENLLHKHSTDRNEREMLMYLIENQNEE